MADVAAEIRSVVLSPYPVSLKNLDLTLRSASPRRINAWAESHPCQTEAFANVVLNALEFCPYALPVLEQIGSAPCLRDEIFRAKPALLDTLLRSAMSHDNNFEKYSKACLSLLSAPLPKGFSAPASIVAFFLRWVEIASTDTTIDAIKAVYTIVSNGFSHLSELLSPSQMSNFNKQMANFLSIQGNRDSHILLLLSLATLARMAIAQGDLEGSSSQPRSSRSKGSVPAEFFYGKKAAKVLPLVTNIVIEIAARDTPEWEVSAELISMATVIVRAVASQIKQQWHSTKESSNISRLLEKTLRPEAHREVVVEVLEFVAVLHDAATLPRLQQTYDKLAAASAQGSHDMNLFLPSSLVCLFSASTMEDLVPDMLRSVLKLGSSLQEPTQELYLLLQARVQFMHSLLLRIPGSQTLRCNILNTLPTCEFGTLLSNFVSATNITKPAGSCEESEICPWNALRLLKQLQLATCSLILQCKLHSQAEETVSLDPSLASNLMEKQIAISMSSTKLECPLQESITNHKASSAIALLEATASPESRISSYKWRENLLDGLVREAARQHGFVVSAIGDICRGLEQRCDSVEKPLREEFERANQLRSELEESKTRCNKLEDEINERNQMLEELEQERLRLEDMLDGAIEKSRDFQNRVAETEELLDIARQDARRIRDEAEESQNNLRSAHCEEIKRMRDEADKAATEHIAVLHDRQDRIEELEQERDQLSDAKIAQAEDMRRLEADSAQLGRGIAELERDLENTISQLGDNREQLAEREARISALEITLEKAEQAKTCLAEQVNQTDQRCEELRGRIEALKAEAVETKKGVEANSARIQAEHTAIVEQTKTTHQEEVRQMKASLAETREEWTNECNMLQAENRSLTKKIHKLQHHQEQKEREAQNLTRQLLGLMSAPADFAQLLATNPAANSGPERRPLSPSLNPGRRRSSSSAHESGFDSKQPDAKRTKTKQTPGRLSMFGAPQHGNNTVAPATGGAQKALGFRPLKASNSPNRRKSYAPEMGKENALPSPQMEGKRKVVSVDDGSGDDVVEEMPDDERWRSSLAESAAETHYAGATGLPVLTSTPNEGVLGGDTFDETTMDF